MKNYKIGYVAFKGTKYADSGLEFFVEARNIISAITKFQKAIHVPINAVYEIREV